MKRRVDGMGPEVSVGMQMTFRLLRLVDKQPLFTKACKSEIKMTALLLETKVSYAKERQIVFDSIQTMLMFAKSFARVVHNQN